MKGIATALVFATLTSIGLSALAGTELENNPPPSYQFNYQIANNGRILEKSVCQEYSGLDWKGCRRYAQWHFAVNCWNLGYDLKHATGKVRQAMLKEKEFFCDAKRRVTRLK